MLADSTFHCYSLNLRGIIFIVTLNLYKTMILNKFNFVLKFFRLGGTQVYLPFSTILILALFFAQGLAKSENILEELIFLIGVMFLILAHELGHIAISNIYKREVKRTTLYFFGGVSESKKTNSINKEIIVTFSGLAITFIISLILFSKGQAVVKVEDLSNLSTQQRLFLYNNFIFFVNLLPIFPLDGEKILRLITEKTTKKRIHPKPGFLSYSLLTFFLILSVLSLDVILFLASLTLLDLISRQSFLYSIESLPEKFKVSKVMTEIDDIKVMEHGQSVKSAFNLSSKSFQPLFPVMLGEEFLGLISRENIIKAMHSNPKALVNSFLNKDAEKINSEESLNSLAKEILNGFNKNFIVMNDEKLVGILFKEKIIEYLLLKDSLKD